MRTLLRVVGVVALGLVAFVVAIFLASEWGGEVVNLYTQDAGGETHATHLWVVEDAGGLWLRAGDPDSGWVQRLRGRDEAEIERDGERTRVRAVVVPERRERVNELMRERYGWVDRVISVLHDKERTLAIRLDPVSR